LSRLFESFPYQLRDVVLINCQPLAAAIVNKQRTVVVFATGVKGSQKSCHNRTKKKLIFSKIKFMNLQSIK
jgi:hypothetical protein